MHELAASTAEARAAAAHGERAGAPVLPPATAVVRVMLQFTGEAGTAAEDVRVSLRLPPGVVAVSAAGLDFGSEEAGTVTVPRLDGGASAPTEVHLQVMCDPTRGMPATTELLGIATYKGSQGEARVAHAAAELPLALFCRAVPPVRL